jgi:heterodisulfide reductase subunit C2
MDDHNSLSALIVRDTGVQANKCYQCGKCSAGCPLSIEMDIAPSQVMRYLQTGLPEDEEKILRSFSIWLCVSCEMCLSRCPMEIDIPRVMDYMRQESSRRKMNHPKSKRIIAFHKSFLDSVRTTGRLYEIGLVADYKMRTGTLMQDVLTAPGMFTRGKLGLLPEMIKGRKEMKSIFKKSTKKEGEK